jgi:hypothetical protein
VTGIPPEETNARAAEGPREVLDHSRLKARGDEDSTPHVSMSYFEMMLLKLNTRVVVAVLLFSLAVPFMFLLHPRLAIRDGDGYSYIMGARSIRRGTGYRDLAGVGFNHWPPGYSLLLSAFPDPVRAALVLNYLFFGVTIGLLYYLLRQFNWDWQPALGFTSALGSGFFRLIANEAHADILTYALFFVAIALAVRGPGRSVAGLIWAFLVPIKMIAVIFLPSAFVADAVARREGWKRLLRSYAPAAIMTAIAAGGVMVFNALTVGALSTNAKSSAETLVWGVERFIASIPRNFLFDWHGTVSAPFPKITLPLCILLAGICFCSLRPSTNGGWLRIYGLTYLVFTWMLLSVRFFDPSVRLTGYGLIVVIMGFRPKKWAGSVWLLYGLLSLIVGITNGVTANCLGSDDPRYAQLATEFRSYYRSTDIVATNSFHILDLHANIASVPVTDYSEADRYQKFFWVTLPEFDALPVTITSMPRPGRGWCEEKQFSGGILFARCPAAMSWPGENWREISALQIRHFS